MDFRIKIINRVTKKIAENTPEKHTYTQYTCQHFYLYLKFYFNLPYLFVTPCLSIYSNTTGTLYTFVLQHTQIDFKTRTNLHISIYLILTRVRCRKYFLEAMYTQQTVFIFGKMCCCCYEMLNVLLDTNRFGCYLWMGKNGMKLQFNLFEMGSIDPFLSMLVA